MNMDHVYIKNKIFVQKKVIIKSLNVMKMPKILKVVQERLLTNLQNVVIIN